ncbi:uncharacterized protein [Fopius arisanus]|uniref:Uncharacterized protein n=2 Tax=Fopius arisanus TaxID=64838 RepID=A0A9R1U1R0_9HYME|nr:PREDICTED: uncharacterized protein LOC105267678 [Fopius arisanus]
MGNVLNNGENNDDLVDILCLLRYIKTKRVERVFRAVDRGDYVLASHRDGAYKDVSWKIGNIHLSAPCVYSQVMEGLSLEAGLSFLNVGSGTGYLSTMVGLILGRHGINHGIELNKDCMEYAYERLEEFKRKSLALNEFDFCEPVFMHGNFLRVIPHQQYDRVYCGAACPESHEAFIKQFVKIGGVLVMPYKDHLLRIERVDTDTWRHKAMLPVAFAGLVIPKDDDQTILHLPFSEPLLLQDLCRCSIRSHLRDIIWQEHPELESKYPITSDTSRHQSPTPILPLNNHVQSYEGSGSHNSTEDEEETGTSSRTRLLVYLDALTPKPPSSLPEFDVSDDEEQEDVRKSSGRTKKISIDSMNSSSSSSSSSSDQEKEKIHWEGEMEDAEELMVVDETESNSIPNSHDDESKAFSNGNEPLSSEQEGLSAEHSQRDKNESSCDVERLQRLLGDGSSSTDNHLSQSGSSSPNKNRETQGCERSFKRDNQNKSDKSLNAGEGTSSERCDFPSPAKKKKWRKLLSREELEGNVGTSKWSPTNSRDSSRTDSSKVETPDWNSLMSFSDDEDTSAKTSSKNPKLNGIHNFVWDSLFGLDIHTSGNEGPSSQSQQSPDNPRNGPQQVFAHNVHANNLEEQMRRKIRALPLPVSLQRYINYNRPL